MNGPGRHILVLLLAIACLNGVYAQEATPVAEPAPSAQVDAQLRINRTTLLENPNPKNRLDAAVLLLTSESPEARTILLEVLARTDNPGSRAAICEALSRPQIRLRDREGFIQPLIGVITSEQDSSIVRLAAEATLLFAYGQVQAELENAVDDSSLPVAARINVIYTIRRHPDKQAVVKLVSLMDSPDLQIVEAARSALAVVGITASLDPAARRQMLAEFQQRGAEAFLRERVIRQETRMREIESDREGWERRYLTALGMLYNHQGDEAARLKFLAQYLAAPETRVKVWALNRLEELRQGTSKVKLVELEPVLIPLISDPSREVRLNTARRLALMGELNIAKPLLDQLNVEQDDPVRRELLIALREACYVAPLTPSGHTIPPEIRTGTLVWAVRFLNETDVEKVRIGAEVIGKLLEQNGLQPEETNGYLKALADRYARTNAGNNDAAFRGHLLSAMAGLCSPRSASREHAAKQFGGIFERALADAAPVVRQAAMDGLMHIDRAGALRRLRKDLANDPSLDIRVRLLDLAAEVGGPQDLDWLAEKLGAAGESDRAWQAMMNVFRRGNAAVLLSWSGKIKSPEIAGKLTREQRVAFFVVAEQKAQSENSAELLREAQLNLADLYVGTNNLKAASDYLRVLLAAGPAGAERHRLYGQSLRVQIGLANLEQASELLSNYLSTKDLDLSPESSVVRCIEEHLGNAASTNCAGLLEALRQVKVSEGDPETLQAWQALLAGWTERYTSAAKKLEENGTVNN
jgi:hypothetical protein